MVLRHLHYAGEPLFDTLATIHNLHFYQQLMQSMRDAIKAGNLAEFTTAFLTTYQSGLPK